jgi:hypothetical protein
VAAVVHQADGERLAFLSTQKSAAVDTWDPTDEENSLTYVDREIAGDVASALDAVASGRPRSKEVSGGDIGNFYLRGDGDNVDVSIWSYPISPDADSDLRKDRAEERRDLVKEQKQRIPEEDEDISAEEIAQGNAEELAEFDAETAEQLADLEARRTEHTVRFDREQAASLSAWLRGFAAETPAQGSRFRQGATDAQRRDTFELAIRGILSQTRLAGKDVHPGGEQLKHWWIYGEGRAKWSTWEELYHHLLKHLKNPEFAKRTAAQWFKIRFGFWPGADLNRIKHGKPPRGHKVGPG